MQTGFDVLQTLAWKAGTPNDRVPIVLEDPPEAIDVGTKWLARKALVVGYPDFFTARISIASLENYFLQLANAYNGSPLTTGQYGSDVIANAQAFVPALQ
jgi:hypothetical protein